MTARLHANSALGETERVRDSFSRFVSVCVMVSLVLHVLFYL